MVSEGESCQCPNKKDELIYKATEGFAKRSIVGEILLVPTGSATRKFNGMVQLNETGAFLWDSLQSPSSEDSLAKMLLNAFDVDEETALNDVQDFIQKGISEGLIYVYNY